MDTRYARGVGYLYIGALHHQVVSFWIKELAFWYTICIYLARRSSGGEDQTTRKNSGMITMLKTLYSGLAAGLAASLLLTPALVSATPCPADIGHDQPISDNVTPSTACELGSENNDSLGGDPSMYQVNLDTMFGFDDWEFAEKVFDADEAIDIGLTTTGDMTSGTWDINDIWATLDVTHLMLVFKGGMSAEPDDYVGYLITFGATSGDYLTPFSQPGNADSSRETSHISAYIRRDGGMRVPEPGTLLLMGLGIIAIGGAARRR